MVWLPVREIIHSLKLVDYLPVQVDKPWYNYYLNNVTKYVNHFWFIDFNTDVTSYVTKIRISYKFKAAKKKLRSCTLQKSKTIRKSAKLVRKKR